MIRVLLGMRTKAVVLPQPQDRQLFMAALQLQPLALAVVRLVPILEAQPATWP